MSRTTVYELLARDDPPAYVRRPMPSLLDPFKDEVRAMLAADPGVRATVVLERLRRSGYKAGISILRDYVRQVRPELAAAASFQRTSYLPGEIGQVDWWHLPISVPVGTDVTRPVLGLVVTLPHSAAHAVVFTLAKTTAAFVAALLAVCNVSAEQLVFDNDTSIVASRSGRNAVLHRGRSPVGPARCQGCGRARAVAGVQGGQVERTIHYLENSFLPLRTFTDLAGLQAQHDRWAAEIAWQRHHRRVGAKVADAHRVETGWLRELPCPLSDVTQRLRCGCPRMASCGSATSTTRSSPAWPAGGCRPPSRSSRSSSGSTAP